MIRALVFDLDDTLYPEHEFVVSGFCAVAVRLAAACGQSSREIERFMLATLEKEGRRAVLPAALSAYPNSGLEVQDLVTVYRGHAPRIRLFAGYADLLKELRISHRLGLITDGAPAVQRAKCAALRLDGIFHSMVFTWEHGSEKAKPHPFPFRLTLNRLGVAAAEALFVGDNPEKDRRGACGVGMKYVPVRKPCAGSRASEGETADLAVDSLLQLPAVLKQIEGQNEAA